MNRERHKGHTKDSPDDWLEHGIQASLTLSRPRDLLDKTCGPYLVHPSSADSYCLSGMLSFRYKGWSGVGKGLRMVDTGQGQVNNRGDPGISKVQSHIQY